MNNEAFAIVLLGMLIVGILVTKQVMDAIHDILTRVSSISDRMKISVGDACLTVATEVGNVKNLDARIMRVIEERLFSKESGHRVSDQLKCINVCLSDIHRASVILTKHGIPVTLRKVVDSGESYVPFSEYEKSPLPNIYLLALSEMIELTAGGTRELTMLDYSTIIAKCRVRLEEQALSSEGDRPSGSLEHVSEFGEVTSI